MSQSKRTHIGIHVGLALVGTLGGLATIGYFSLKNWFSPATPLVMMATAVVLPLIAVNLVVALIGSADDVPLGKSIGPPFLVTLLIGGLGVGASAAWFAQSVRMRGLEEAAKRGMRQGVVRALEDPARPIVAAACSHVFSMGVGNQRLALLDLLDRRPDIGRACLNRAAKRLKGTPKAEQVTEIAEVLGERWHDRLLAEDASGPAPACRYAPHLGALPEPARGSVGIPTLLSCTIGAPTSEVRSCCGTALTDATGRGGAIVEGIGQSVSRKVGTRLAPSLAQASLHQLQMEDAERARLVRLGLTKPAVRRWTIRFGCSYVLASQRSNDLVNQFSAWLDASDCPADADSVRGDLGAWQRICRQTVSTLEGAKPTDALCRAARGDVRAATFEAASDRVHAAIDGAFHSLMDSKIAAGSAMLERMSNSRRAAYRQMARELRESGANLGAGDVRMIITRMANGKLPPRAELQDIPAGKSVDEILGKLKENPKLAEELDEKSADYLQQAREQMSSDAFKEKVEAARERYQKATD